MEMDTSVSMTVGAEMNVVSHLEPDDFAHRVLELMPSDVKSADLGCGRILTEWSILLQTRYVLCDLYEDTASKSNMVRKTAAPPTSSTVPCSCWHSGSRPGSMSLL